MVRIRNNDSQVFLLFTYHFVVLLLGVSKCSIFSPLKFLSSSTVDDYHRNGGDHLWCFVLNIGDLNRRGIERFFPLFRMKSEK